MRGRWLALTGLVLMVGSIGLLLFIKPPAANAQTSPPEVTYTLSCFTNAQTGAKTVSYALRVKNTNTVAVPYTPVRGWTDGRADHTGNTLTVNPGATTNFPYSSAESATAQWTHTLRLRSGDQEVITPITRNNPCLVVPPAVTYDVTCVKNATTGAPESVAYAPTIRNPNASAITYTLVLGWSDPQQQEVTKTVPVPAGGTVSGDSVNHTSTANLGAQWTHTLTVKEGTAVVGTPITRPNPCYAAPEPPEPPVVTYEVTCRKNADDEPESVLYAPTIENPNAVAVTYTLVLSWSDEREEVSADVAVAAGETASGDEVNFSSDTGLAEEWTNTLTVKVGEDVVGTPIEKQNPCRTDPPSSSSSSPPPTDPLTTSTTDIAATSGGGGLATTGIAVAAILGAGLLLFGNGVGLMRLVRKGEHE